MTDYGGNLVQDHWFYPWGQDWALNGTLYDERFASLQRRDTETTLDPTRSRMFSSTDGRWMSPDPTNGSASMPQSLNRYAYALDRPAHLIDPEGLDAACVYAYDDQGNFVWGGCDETDETNDDGGAGAGGCPPRLGHATRFTLMETTGGPTAAKQAARLSFPSYRDRAARAPLFRSPPVSTRCAPNRSWVALLASSRWGE